MFCNRSSFVSFVIVVCRFSLISGPRSNPTRRWGVWESPSSLVQVPQHKPNLIARSGLILLVSASVWLATYSHIKASTSNHLYFLLPEPCLVKLFAAPFSPNMGLCFALQKFSSKNESKKRANQILLAYLFSDQSYLSPGGFNPCEIKHDHIFPVLGLWITHLFASISVVLSWTFLMLCTCYHIL